MKYDLKGLKLFRPLCFLDLETTHVSVARARIVEISIVKIHPDGKSETFDSLINPGMSIPKESSKIHGITDESVSESPRFTVLAQEILDFIENTDLVGFNSNNYDIPILALEMDRAGLDFDHTKHNLVDVCNIFKINEDRTLRAAYRFYCNKELVDAHTASADVKATIDVFISQVSKYNLNNKSLKDLAVYSNYGKPILDLSGFFVEKNGGIYFNKGKYIDELAKEKIDYLFWLLKEPSIKQDTKSIATRLINEVDKEKRERKFGLDSW